MTTLKPLTFFNTLSRTQEKFSTLEPGLAKVYCCGPTVYNFQHIGNLRTYIFEDLLARTLRAAGYRVKHVMNITDVGHLVSDADAGEDKMMVAAKREKKSSHQIADYYSEIFFDDCRKLNIIRPEIVCKATEHIQEMIELIKRLEQRGYTYTAGGNVYFDISKNSDYGKLARLKIENLEAGARIEVDQHKRNPHDFALWFTKSKFEGQELQWDSPWGRGYPGWHIECSAMSIKYLGEEFDIHCGGIDHVPVHHTNEIAQSECATGKPWVRLWMHGEFLLSESHEKMAKSTGGFITLKTVEERGLDPLVYRMLCLSAHYRSQLAFSWEAMDGAAQTLDRLRRTVLALKKEGPPAFNDGTGATLKEEFFSAFAHDLNAPQALAVLWRTLGDSSLTAASKLGILYSFDEILGLGMAQWKEEVVAIPAEIMALAQARAEARKAKDFARADELRKQLTAKGYTVEDSPKGPVVKPL